MRSVVIFICRYLNRFHKMPDWKYKCIQFAGKFPESCKKTSRKLQEKLPESSKLSGSEIKKKVPLQAPFFRKGLQ